MLIRCPRDKASSEETVAMCSLILMSMTLTDDVSASDSAGGGNDRVIGGRWARMLRVHATPMVPIMAALES